ncbi:MAG: hypothetical protein EA357_02715 [Micavibrio sp.]|nr:MAG: hypothetical protein EA357_02715 [Micavibrio sp.]
MNVKIDGKSLRFKISADELDHLLSGEIAVQHLPLGGGAVTVMIDPKAAVEGGMTPHMLVQNDNATLRLLVAREKLEELKNLGRDRNGLREECNGIDVTLLLDIRKPPKTL